MPELRRLVEEAQRLWGDAAARRNAIEAIARGMEGRADLVEAVARVDVAVCAGLRVLGLPRGPVQGSVQVMAGHGPQGLKEPDCTLRLWGEHIRSLTLHPRGPDTTFKTWLHESLHTRQPYSDNYANEYRHHRGFEEGMVEGLALHLVRDKARMDPLAETYRAYVAAYNTLARVVGVNAEHLRRALWSYPAGQVRGALVPTLDTLRREVTGQPLTSVQRQRIRGMADRMFSSDRLWDRPDERAMIAVWRTVLR